MLRPIWLQAQEVLKGQIPNAIKKRRFNFITIHYLYMLGMIITGSVIIFVIGGMRYIDCLFFASGASTQSGLNTVDVDTIHVGQQFVLYILAMFCNPIVVHGAVVFVRLYWFEKRFQHIVREARSLRRTKEKSRSNTFNKEDPEALSVIPEERLSTRARGKDIIVLRNNRQEPDRPVENEKEVDTNAESLSPSNNSERNSGASSDGPIPQGLSRRGALPDILSKGSADDMRLPQPLSTEQHIAFLENQRNPKDKAVLRIPSPREFDQGGQPKNLDDGDEEDEDREAWDHHGTGMDERLHDMSNWAAKWPPKPSGPPVTTHITIDEPNILRPRDKVRTFPTMSSRHGPASHPKPPDGPVPWSRSKKRSTTFSSFRRSNTAPLETMPYLSWEPTVGRNSLFVNLTELQREELGGIEYRALKTLAVVLITYFIAFHLVGVICLVPWILRTPTYGQVVTGDGQGRTWWAIFTAGSAFNDLGFTLTPDSMISFGPAVFPMLLMTFLIVIGNTGFPCMLRFTIWFASKCVIPGSALWEELQFLLDHPRRCFTLLFPRAATWWLFAVLVILNGVDLLFFVVLDLNDPTVSSIPAGLRVLDGLFQASSTRTAGFSVVNLANLHPAIQVSYLIMMYISVFPIAISMRRTNVYEERSLGIYSSPTEDDDDAVKGMSYVGTHLMKQLSFDLWYVFLGMFIIAIVEGDRLQNTNEYAFTLFSVLFEIVSAYGTVGLSLGYPTINASFSAEFATLSKLVIIAMQIRGRHRGLPYELDRAVLLPSEKLHEKEKKESERIMARRRSSVMRSSVGSGMSAVVGSLPSDHFRPETGLSSAHSLHHNSTSSYHSAKERSNSTTASHLNLNPNQNQGGSTRSGLGNAMFRRPSADLPRMGPRNDS